MKRNKFLRTAAILLALAFVMSIGTVSTLARYVKLFEQDPSQLVRAGVFNVSAVAGPVSVAEAYALEGTGGLHYASSNSDAIIVPGLGIKASGTVTINNLSEVDVEVGLADTAEITAFDGVDLFLYYDNAGAKGDPIDLTDIDLGLLLGGVSADTLTIAAGGSLTPTLTVWVEWEEDGCELGDDVDDSADTKFAPETVGDADWITITLDLAAAQILPGE